MAYAVIDGYVPQQLCGLLSIDLFSVSQDVYKRQLYPRVGDG